MGNLGVSLRGASALHSSQGCHHRRKGQVMPPIHRAVFVRRFSPWKSATPPGTQVENKKKTTMRPAIIGAVVIILASFAIGIPGNAAAQVAKVAPGVYLLPTEGGVGVGKELQMVLVQVPGTAMQPASQTGELGSDYTVTWASSDSDIAAVVRGRVTGRRIGMVTITATVERRLSHSRQTLRSIVRVGEPVARVEGQRTLAIHRYCSARIQVRTFGAGGVSLDNRPVTWESARPEIAAVSPPISRVVAIQSVAPTTEKSRAAADAIFFQRAATVLGRQVGQSVVTATSEGVSNAITLDVLPGDPSSLHFFRTLWC